jgi:hypothetical protein
MQEPIEPTKPATSIEAKAELNIALASAISAIAKTKGIAIIEAVVSGGETDENKATLEFVIQTDKVAWDKYNEDHQKYRSLKEQWDKQENCKKFGLTPAELDEGEKRYYAFNRTASNGEYKNREHFWQIMSEEKKTGKIIEVA